MRIQLRGHIKDGEIVGAVTAVTGISSCGRIIDYEWQEHHTDGRFTTRTHSCRFDRFYELPMVTFEQITFQKA